MNETLPLLASSSPTDHASVPPGIASEARPAVPAWAGLAGLVGVLALGSSFLILPQPPAISAPLAQLVGYSDRHHNLLLCAAWLEAAGSTLFVAFLISLATIDAHGPRAARFLAVFAGAAVGSVGLLYAVTLIAYAQSGAMGGPQLQTATVAYGLFAATEHAFLLAPPVFLPLGFALRGSTVLPARFSTAAIGLGCASTLLGLSGLFYARPNTGGPAGFAIDVLLGIEAIWVAAAAVSLYSQARHRRSASRSSSGTT